MAPRIVLLLLSAGSCLVACSPALDWREVQPAGDALRAVFPCRPAQHAREVLLAGRQTEMTMAACEASGMTFAVAHADISVPADVPRALEELRSAAVANVRHEGPALRSPWVVPGATPNAQAGRLEVDGMLPSGASTHLSAVFFVRGLRVYQATVIAPRGDGDAAESFISGLKLNT